MQDYYFKANSIADFEADVMSVSPTDTENYSLYVVGDEIETPATFDNEGNVISEATYTGKVLINVRVREGFNIPQPPYANGTEMVNPITPNAKWM